MFDLKRMKVDLKATYTSPGPRVVVASLPRCGSTWLVRSILGEPQGGSCPELPPWLVKTHRHPTILRPDDRAVFLHGDMAEAVVSTKRRRNDPNHFANMDREYKRVDLLREDYLGYAALVDAWLACEHEGVRCYTYEQLQDDEVRAEIEEHIGREVSWLPWRGRDTRVGEEKRALIRETYGWDGTRCLS